MPIVVEFVSTLNAPPELVWDRVASISGANKEVWPWARMTRPSFDDRMTSKEPGVLPPFRTWFLAFGFLPIAGKMADAFNKASVSATFNMRHRRLRRHFNA